MSDEPAAASEAKTTPPAPAAPAMAPAAPPPTAPKAEPSATDPPWFHLRPVWELELLISGAVVFSLFQLPSLLSRAYFAIEMHLSSQLFLLPFLLFYVVSLAVIALILAFSTHFFLRGFWVALCGLNSVFPEGILWDRFDGGPIQRRVFQDLLPDPRVLERRVDRLASTVFSALFVVLASLVFGLFWVLALVLLANVATRFWARETDPARVFYVLLVLWLLPLMAAGALDRWFKKQPAQLDRRPRLAKAVERTLRVYQRAFAGQLYNSIFLVFSTRYSTRRSSIVSAVATLLLAVLFLSYFMVRAGLFGFDSYQYFPTRPGPSLVRADHYEDMRTESSARVSTIQSEIVEGPYVRLFVPYLVNRDRELVAEHCPDLEPLRGDGLFLAVRARGSAEQVAEVAGCLRRIYEVRIDGTVVDLAGLDFHRRPSDGVVGVFVHIPAANLSAGRHLIEVARAPLERHRERDDRLDRDPRRREYLPFWR